MEGTAYSDMMESVGSDVTKYVYKNSLAAFMAAVPDGVFEKYAGIRPKSRGIEDMCEAFVGLARSNPDAAKAAVRSYVKGLKELVGKGRLSPNTVPNKIKPVKALLAAAEIDLSWRAIKTPPVKSRDRAYPRDELRAVLAAFRPRANPCGRLGAPRAVPFPTRAQTERPAALVAAGAREPRAQIARSPVSALVPTIRAARLAGLVADAALCGGPACAHIRVPAAQDARNRAPACRIRQFCPASSAVNCPPVA